MTPEEKELALIEKIKTEVAGKANEIISANPSIKELPELVEKLKSAVTKAELKELADKLTALKMEEVKEIVISLQTELTALKENPTKQAKGKSIREQIKSQLESRKEEWAKFIKSGSGNFAFELDFKAAGTMLESDHITADTRYLPQPEFTPGYVDLVRNKPFLESYSNSSGTSSPRIVWVEKVNADGQCAFIAEGAVKPLIDFDWKTNTSVAKKVADKIKVSTEMLEDIDFMAAAIQNELRYQVDIVTDEQLLSGAGGDSLTGLTSVAGGYVLATITTANANNSDAIRAAIAQIASLNFSANYAFVNPIDAANMDLTKADDSGVYMLPPFTSADGRVIAGVRVVESNQIPVGDVLVGDMTKFIIRNYKPFTATMGWVNDDFEKNLVTVIGERRLHSYVPDNHTGAFVYDSFATIKAALAPAP